MTLLIDLINAMPDDPRAAIYPALRVLAFIFSWQLFEDGSIIP